MVAWMPQCLKLGSLPQHTCTVQGPACLELSALPQHVAHSKVQRNAFGTSASQDAALLTCSTVLPHPDRCIQLQLALLEECPCVGQVTLLRNCQLHCIWCNCGQTKQYRELQACKRSKEAASCHAAGYAWAWD